MITWRQWEGAHAAFERGSVRADVRQRVDCPIWNLHLHDLPYDVAVFQYRTPETAMKHATRWLERHPMVSVEQIRRRTDLLFSVPPAAPRGGRAGSKIGRR